MKRTPCCFLIVLFTALLISSCVNDPGPEQENPKGFQWTVSTPASLGLNASMINDGINTAAGLGFVNSLLVIRGGKIAAEKYFNGGNANSFQSVRSVSKSFLSALVGIAVERKLMRLDDKMIDYFPEYKSYVTDTRINNITLEHLLTMRGGIKGDEEIYVTFTFSANWIKTILGLPLASDPGSASRYSTAGTHLISGMLTKAAGMSSAEFGNKFLFEPAGIMISDWLRDPQGIYFGGSDMIFTTRNMAALGLLYINGGALNAKQIVPEEWVNKSLIYSGSSGGSWGSLSSAGYGYLWWLGQLAGHKVFFALGYGGQYIICVPELDLIVAATSDPNALPNDSDPHERAVMKLISDYIIPSAGN